MTTPLISASSEKLLQEPVVVAPLTYSQIPKALRSFKAAFVGNPQQHYLKDTPDKPKGRWPSIAGDIAGYISTVLWVYRHNCVVNAVDGGSSAVYAAHAPNSPKGKKTRSERVLEGLAKKIMAVLRTDSPQQRERKEEMSGKLAVLTAAIEHSKDDMLYVELLFTAPEAQGRGYASAVMRSIIDIADSQHRGIWLFSGDVANLAFYGFHGFNAVGDVALGDVNPEWHEPPAVITLMVRESKTRSSVVDEKA